MPDIHRLIRQRDERLTRFAKNHPAAAADVVNALAKVRYLRGEPDEYDCTTCLERAEEWQLVELAEREGPRFLLYSNDPDHYSPFCTTCALEAERSRWKRLEGCP